MNEYPEDILITALDGFGYPVFRQGSLSEEEPYPQTFVTWWNASEDGIAFYDNSTTAVEYRYYVNVYSTSTNTVYSLLRQIWQSLKQIGFVSSDRGHDVASDEVTHIGRGMTVIYRREEE